jgi:para-aminobenzoate synthetase component 1
MFVEELRPAPDPVRCCELLGGLPYRIFFDAAERAASLGRYSFLSADPVAVVRGKGERTEYVDLVKGTSRRMAGDALQLVKAALAPHRVEPRSDLPPFQGGAAGYLGYEWARVLERLPAARHDDLALPDAVLGIYDWVLAWNHEASRAFLMSTGLPETLRSARSRRAAERAQAVRGRLSERTAPRPAAHSGRPQAAVHDAGRAPSFPVEHERIDPRLGIRSSFTHDGYLEAVQRVREYIVAGDIFQANLSQRLEAALAEPPWTLYRRLRVRNRAPFAAFLDFPDGTILSASPERFLRVDGGGRVETRPIKGTRPRGLGPEHDAALGAALIESDKDRAENLMIVDLMRNDLSRVCAPGTVRVDELFALEHFATVHHLVSTVVGALKPGTDALDLLRAAFPAGSITGAPKLRAMEVIAELEPSTRGVYCGAIGYWSVGGQLDCSVAIRTAVVRAGQIYFNAGGGIVADSDPEQEYLETLDKARGFIDALTNAA